MRDSGNPVPADVPPATEDEKAEGPEDELADRVPGRLGFGLFRAGRLDVREATLFRLRGRGFGFWFRSMISSRVTSLVLHDRGQALEGALRAVVR